MKTATEHLEGWELVFDGDKIWIGLVHDAGEGPGEKFRIEPVYQVLVLPEIAQRGQAVGVSALNVSVLSVLDTSPALPRLFVSFDRTRVAVAEMGNAENWWKSIEHARDKSRAKGAGLSLAR